MWYENKPGQHATLNLPVSFISHMDSYVLLNDGTCLEKCAIRQFHFCVNIIDCT